MLRKSAPVFFQIGLVMAIACIVLVWWGHRSVEWMSEVQGMPLAWVAGGVAVASLLMYELCDSLAAKPPKTKHPQREAEHLSEAAPQKQHTTV
jgi:purine-cytosine permease-like protein